VGETATPVAGMTGLFSRAKIIIVIISISYKFLSACEGLACPLLLIIANTGNPAEKESKRWPKKAKTIEGDGRDMAVHIAGASGRRRPQGMKSPWF